MRLARVLHFKKPFCDPSRVRHVKAVEPGVARRGRRRRTLARRGFAGQRCAPPPPPVANCHPSSGSRVGRPEPSAASSISARSLFLARSAPPDMLLVTSPTHLCFLDAQWSVGALTSWVPACPSAGPAETTSPGRRPRPSPCLSGLRPAILPCPSVPRDGLGVGGGAGLEV